MIVGAEIPVSSGCAATSAADQRVASAVAAAVWAAVSVAAPAGSPASWGVTVLAAVDVDDSLEPQPPTTPSARATANR